MIKFNEIKLGDYLLADNDGNTRRGQVTRLNGDEKQVCVNVGAQEFFYELDQLMPIVVNDAELSNLKFEKTINENGNVKYSKGAFRMIIPSEGNFSKFELWYRDETRQIPHEMYVHNLQNHFLDMTKVHLDEQSF